MCVRSRLVGHGGDQFPKLERGDRYVRICIRTRVSLGGPPTPESTCIHPGRSDDKDSFGGTALELLFPSSLYSQNYITLITKCEILEVIQGMIVRQTSNKKGELRNRGRMEMDDKFRALVTTK